MAINVNVYDLEGYPENSKTVTLDLLNIVPVGAQGDEKFVLTCKTNAYSNYTNKTTINDIFIQEFLCGWGKSSGFKGAVFTITVASNDKLRVKIDNASNGVNSGYYEITLEPGVNLTGDAIATDIQAKLRALTLDTGDSGKQLGYTNCRCSFTHSRFVIKSGTISKLLSGSSASSVEVFATVFGASANETLGFDLPVESKMLAGTDIREVVVASPYTSGTSPLTVVTGLDITDGDSMYITDGTNIDYFTVISGTETSMEVAVSGIHGFDGIAHNYVSGSKVQKLRYSDPEYKPESCLDSIDDALTWGILSLANQIDYSG